MNHRLKKGKWITNIYLVKWQHIYIREKNKRYPSYLWNLPSPDNLNHKFLRYRLKILAHNDVVVVCLTNNETKAEILWNNNKNKKRKRKLGRAFSFGENIRLSHYLLSLPSLLCSFTGDWSNSRHTPLSRYSHPRSETQGLWVDFKTGSSGRAMSPGALPHWLTAPGSPRMRCSIRLRYSLKNK